MHWKATRTGPRHDRMAQRVLTMTICVRIRVFGVGMDTFNFEYNIFSGMRSLWLFLLSLSLCMLLLAMQPTLKVGLAFIFVQQFRVA